MDSLQGYPIHQLSAFIFFVMPVVILLFLYVSMAITLRGSIRDGRKALHCHHCKAAQSYKGPIDISKKPYC